MTRESPENNGKTPVIRGAIRGRPQSTTRTRIFNRLRRGAASGKVWSTADFLDLGARGQVINTLTRMVDAEEVQSLGRGLFFRPRINPLTSAPTSAGASDIVAAIARRDGLRLIGDGMAAANRLGLTTAVAAQPIWYADRAREPFAYSNLLIEIRQAPHWLLKWQGAPGGEIVNAMVYNQSVYRADDTWNVEECRSALAILQRYAECDQGQHEIEGLRRGFASLPAWIQDFVRPLVAPHVGPSWGFESEDDNIDKGFTP